MMGTYYVGNYARQSMQHSLALSAFFPTTWMSEEVLLAAQSVRRMQHEGMLCLSFSITIQLVFLKKEIRVTTFFYACFRHLIVVQ